MDTSTHFYTYAIIPHGEKAHDYFEMALDLPTAVFCSLESVKREIREDLEDHFEDLDDPDETEPLFPEMKQSERYKADLEAQLAKIHFDEKPIYQFEADIVDGTIAVAKVELRA